MKTEISAKIAARVREAVVRIPRFEGQGVLVPGGLVVTAAHCVQWSAEGEMALGDHGYREAIVTSDGRRLVVEPVAVEPVSDLAVLAAVDSQEHRAAAEAFEAFSESTKPVRLAVDNLDVDTPIAGYVFTHDGRIVPVRARQMAPGCATLFIEADEKITGGTSGGPVVTRDGRLLGIVSSTGEAGEEERVQRKHSTCSSCRARLAGSTDGVTRRSEEARHRAPAWTTSSHSA